jgi:hypothetical protein
MKFHVFVTNRVADILDMMAASQWRYVASTDNPADDCSRGLLGSEISAAHRWFIGPKFLPLSEETWPVKTVMSESESADPEVSGPMVYFTSKTAII